ncbi:MAG: ATP-binding protein [Chitinophagaceae bacterium]
MTLTVKQKIRLGTLFLFLLLVISAGLGIFYLNKLKNDAALILRNNYESIDYCNAMLRSLDKLDKTPVQSLQQFRTSLLKQDANITEEGERLQTRKINTLFQQILPDGSPAGPVIELRQAVNDLLDINMSAIESRNQQAMNTADRALRIITTLAAVIVLIGITFTYNFPSIVTAPLNAIIAGIREIGRKNYQYRIHLDNKDEFGQMAEAFNSMGERLEYFEHSNLNKILFEKARAESVINSLKDATIGIDKGGRILFANDQALHLLGLSSEEMLGKEVDVISKRNDLFAFLMVEQGNLPFKIVVDNRENYFIREVIEIDQDENNSRVITLRNITSFKELDVARTNFIATISHELKTPLASTDFSIKLLEDVRIGDLTEEQKGLVQSMRIDNQRMLRILSELLNMAQVESGRIQLDAKPVEPASVAVLALKQTGGAAKAKKVRLVVDTQPGLPRINADAEKTAWVLNNFLTNAIRYSPEGAEVKLSVTTTDNVVRFEVIDHGPGIPSEYLPRLFDRFFTVPGTGKKGSGIGLSIAREFIEAQEGQVWVNSIVGEGSTFGFSLPVVKEL